MFNHCCSKDRDTDIKIYSKWYNIEELKNIGKSLRCQENILFLMDISKYHTKEIPTIVEYEHLYTTYYRKDSPLQLNLNQDIL